MKLIVWTRPDTGIAEIVYPPYNGVGAKWAGWTHDEILAWSIEHQVGKDDQGQTMPYNIIEDTDTDVAAFLADRSFRSAWEWSD